MDGPDTETSANIAAAMAFIDTIGSPETKKFLRELRNSRERSVTCPCKG
jgi:hypothetical protein